MLSWHALRGGQNHNPEPGECNDAGHALGRRRMQLTGLAASQQAGSRGGRIADQLIQR